jgi:ferritin-like metal-binding protein YciE
MAGRTLKELFVETLRDIYFAEKQILRALPKMANAAHSDALRAGFKLHREETEGHVARLEEIFAMLDLTPRGKTCEAILGIIEEGKEIMSDFHGTPSLDAGLVSAGQAVEHYEIARYGTLKTWAGQLGLAEARTLLQKTLDEEVATDRKLSELAESDLNRKAA